MDLFNYLRSNELVVRIQQLFGIKYLETSKNGVMCNDSGIDTNSDENGSDTTNGLDRRLDDVKVEQPRYQITNRFWYYLFIIGTELGDELFYVIMIPFWFWNIDGAVGRRVVFIWSTIMYIGQSLKDIIKWPRPGWPVEKLQKKWGLEYGMPSTHAMVAVSMPFSVVIFMFDRYQYSLPTGIIIATLWCLLICTSRVYLGVHCVLDIIAGIILTIVLMIPLVPLIDYLDPIILSSRWSPIVTLAVTISAVYFYPTADKWTPTRGDTTLTVAVLAGLQIGAWLNYQLGQMEVATIDRPYEILWPTTSQCGCTILRTVLGLCCLFGVRAISKTVVYAVLCAWLGRDTKDVKNSEYSLENWHKNLVDLIYKYFFALMIGFNTQYLLPNVFKLMGIGRTDFYTEI